jgi:hypothetical protein
MRFNDRSSCTGTCAGRRKVTGLHQTRIFLDIERIFTSFFVVYLPYVIDESGGPPTFPVFLSAHNIEISSGCFQLAKPPGFAPKARAKL